MFTLRRDEETQGRVEFRIVDPSTRATHGTSSEEKEAILASLYDERAKLNRAKRLGTISRDDDEYLSELDRYVNRWEAVGSEDTEDAVDDVFARLEAVASMLLGVQAKIERQR